ncbi:MAG: trimethylamine methyltransferase family protein [Armatimonadetes bacterium]|nr:trimethylamine methyltransferase family protein [Armatimonadota bacterium]
MVAYKSARTHRVGNSWTNGVYFLRRHAPVQGGFAPTRGEEAERCSPNQTRHKEGVSSMFEAIKGLTDSQIEQIRSATEDILETKGFHVTHPELKRLCREAGAIVDDPDDTVRFPTPLLHDLLAHVPSQYEIADCKGNLTTIGGDQQVGLGIVTDPWIIDWETQQPRRPCIDDIRKHTTLQQRLPLVKSTSRMDFPVTDVEGPTSSFRALEEWFLLQDMHLSVFVTSIESLEQYYDIGRLILRGRDLKGSKLMTVAVAPLSPLGFTDMNAELLLRTCKYDFTVVPTVCPMAGTTSPYTLAGTLLMGNVENLFVAALSQVVNPGNPFLYSFGPSVANMRSGHDQYYTLDKVLWKMAGVQMGKSYRWPTVAESGGTMTFRYDQQNAAEGILFMLVAHASGANILAGFGSNYNAIGMSAEMILIQTAWLESARFLKRGIQFDDHRLGVETIKSVGSGASYLMDDLTLEFLRGGEFFTNDLFDFSGGFEESKSLLERAHEKVEELSANPTSPHPQDLQAEIKDYFARLYARLGEA